GLPLSVGALGPRALLRLAGGLPLLLGALSPRPLFRPARLFGVEGGLPLSLGCSRPLFRLARGFCPALLVCQKRPCLCQQGLRPLLLGPLGTRFGLRLCPALLLEHGGPPLSRSSRDRARPLFGLGCGGLGLAFLLDARVRRHRP